MSVAYENQSEQENAEQGDMAIARKILFEVLGREKYKGVGLLTGSVPAIVEAMQSYVAIVMQYSSPIKALEAIHQMVSFYESPGDVDIIKIREITKKALQK